MSKNDKSKNKGSLNSKFETLFIAGFVLFVSIEFCEIVSLVNSPFIFKKFQSFVGMLSCIGSTVALKILVVLEQLQPSPERPTRTPFFPLEMLKSPNRPPKMPVFRRIGPKFHPANLSRTQRSGVRVGVPAEAKRRVGQLCQRDKPGFPPFFVFLLLLPP